VADGSRFSADPRKARAGLVLGGPRTVGILVEELATRLEGFDNALVEAREIVAALLDVPRHWPQLRENKWVDDETWSRACSAADKRVAGAPLAYAVGRANFRALTLDVDERVLIPRPETELLVDLVLEHVGPGGIAVDVGCGSGAIAIALATEGRFDRVIGTDISRDALDVAGENAGRIGADVGFVHGDLLAAVAGSRGPMGGGRLLRAVVSNPPYIAFSEISELPPSVRDWEPPVALLSAANGLATTARLVRQAVTALEPGGLLALEVDARRASLVAELVSSHGQFQDIVVHLDLAGRERFVLATRVRNEQ
jgi:release factor glutamine methyltransferase